MSSFTLAIAPSVIGVLTGTASSLVVARAAYRERRARHSAQEEVEKRINTLVAWIGDKSINSGDTISTQIPGVPGELVTLSNATGTSRDERA